MYTKPNQEHFCSLTSNSYLFFFPSNEYLVTYVCTWIIVAQGDRVTNVSLPIINTSCKSLLKAVFHSKWQEQNSVGEP